MAFAEDLSIYFTDFGDDGLLAGQPVRVIYDAPFEQQLGGVGMAAAVPQAQIDTASVPAGVEGQPLVIPQGSFVVREHIADGTGMSLLMLTKAAA